MYIELVLHCKLQMCRNPKAVGWHLPAPHFMQPVQGITIFFQKTVFIGLIIIRNIKCSACSTPLPSSVCFFVCSNVKEEGQGYHLKKLKQHQLDGFSPMFAHIFTTSWFHSFQPKSLGSPFRRTAMCISIILGQLKRQA